MSAATNWLCRIGLHRWSRHEVYPSGAIWPVEGTSCKRCGKEVRLVSPRDQALDSLVAALRTVDDDHMLDAEGMCGCDEWFETLPDYYDHLNRMRLLAALSHETNVTCEMCGGTGHGKVQSTNGLGQVSEYCMPGMACEPCHGSGQLPVKLIIGEQVGWLSEPTDDDMVPTGEYSVFGGHDLDHPEHDWWRHDGIRYENAPVYRALTPPVPEKTEG